MSTPTLTLSISPDSVITGAYDNHFLSTYRLASSDLVGQPTAQLPQSPISKTIKNLSDLTLERAEPISLINQIEASNGLRTVQGHCTPLPGNVGGTVLILQDNTLEYKTQEDTSRQEKLTSLSAFARGVAHSMNNALVGIIGHAALAEQSLPPYHAARFNIEQLLKAADKTTELASHLMTYAGHHDTAVRSTDLEHFLKDNTALFEATTGEQINVQLREISSDTPKADVDAKLLQDGLIALLTELNAFAPSEEPLEIHLDLLPALYTQDSDELITLTGRMDPGSYAILHISVPGGNVKASDLRHWFDPFQHKRPSDFPLGPASLLAAARLQKGGLTAYIDMQKTLHVRLFLPAAKPRVESASEPEPEIEFKASGKALIIDDEPAVREVAEQMLTQMGFEVLTAETGETGLDLATKHIEQLSLVVLDLHMPGFGGGETFRGLRLIQPDLRILISSGYNEKEAMKHFPATAGTGFLQKPYRIEDFGSSVRTLYTRPVS